MEHDFNAYRSGLLQSRLYVGSPGFLPAICWEQGKNGNVLSDKGSERRVNCEPHGKFNRKYGSLEGAKFQLQLVKRVGTPFEKDFEKAFDVLTKIQGHAASTQDRRNFIVTEAGNTNFRFGDHVFEKRNSGNNRRYHLGFKRTTSQSRLYQFATLLILFKPFGDNASSMLGLPKGVLPLFPSQQSFKIDEKPDVTSYRKQFALTPAYAFTDIKSQGQTQECVIIDIGKLPSGSLTGFNAYVALSTNRGRDTIRLLRGFDPRLFTVHPNEQLRTEDERLAALEAATLLRYKSSDSVTTYTANGKEIENARVDISFVDYLYAHLPLLSS
ncbi:hypothetical protein EDB83DRAFT_2538232 [Lactarius deliciosus]|nr:hypothetical protein EDB83DRAFT_2538232 [Lactarius deliciosus]